MNTFFKTGVLFIILVLFCTITIYLEQDTYAASEGMSEGTTQVILGNTPGNTANNGNVRGQFRGFGMRFVTLLSPISDVLNALQDGRIRYYDDVLRISHQ